MKTVFKTLFIMLTLLIMSCEKDDDECKCRVKETPSGDFFVLYSCNDDPLFFGGPNEFEDGFRRCN